MDIVTVGNEKWLGSHVYRWARIARRSNPQARLHLLYCGEDREENAVTFSMFDEIKKYPSHCDNRPWYNSIRMRATSELGIEEVLYCDADADILQSLEYVPLFCDRPLMYVRSPGISQEWREICEKNGWPVKGVNNGLLYLRKDYGAMYDEIHKRYVEQGCSPRLVGTYAFNVLVRELADESAELPYYTSVIARDYINLTTARVVQYCNDENQAHRLRLEQEWRDAVVR